MIKKGTVVYDKTERLDGKVIRIERIKSKKSFVVQYGGSGLVRNCYEKELKIRNNK